MAENLHGNGSIRKPADLWLSSKMEVQQVEAEKAQEPESIGGVVTTVDVVLGLLTTEPRHQREVANLPWMMYAQGGE